MYFMLWNIGIDIDIGISYYSVMSVDVFVLLRCCFHKNTARVLLYVHVHLFKYHSHV